MLGTPGPVSLSPCGLSRWFSSMTAQGSLSAKADTITSAKLYGLTGIRCWPRFHGEGGDHPRVRVLGGVVHGDSLC